MQTNFALAFYTTKFNKYTINSLLGTLESDEYFEDFNIYFIKNKNSIISDLETLLEKHKKIILAFSFFTTQIWETYEIISLINSSNLKSKILTIAGGPHPSGDPKGTLKMGFDLVICGEGEETLIELLKKFDLNDNYKTIKGIAYLDDDNNFIFNGHRDFVDLNKYKPFSLKYYRIGPLEITRGCSSVCYFCQTPQLFKAKVRHRSIEKIIEYVKILSKYNFTYLRFITPSAFSYGSQDGKTINLDTLETFLKSIKECMGQEGKIFIGSFPSEVRPEHINDETISLLKKYAANDNIVIGAQSGSQKILDLCHRGHTVVDVYNAVKSSVKAGFIPNVDFIFGLPGETEEDIFLTIKTMKDLVNLGARIHAHTFMPLPQTPFSKANAGTIDTKIQKIINELVPKKIIHGNWKEQEKLAKKIALYLQTGTF